jgi:hypothetical protein
MSLAYPPKQVVALIRICLSVGGSGCHKTWFRLGWRSYAITPDSPAVTTEQEATGDRSREKPMVASGYHRNPNYLTSQTTNKAKG